MSVRPSLTVTIGDARARARPAEPGQDGELGARGSLTLRALCEAIADSLLETEDDKTTTQPRL